VKLPKGLRVASSKHSLSAGLTVRGSSGKRVKFSAKADHGVPTVMLTSAAPKAQVTISSPALTATASLAAKVKRHKAGKVSFVFTVTDKTHVMTKLTSKDKIS
jgi:hypothetical protein